MRIPRVVVDTSIPEQAFLVGLAPKRGTSLWSLDDSLEELAHLAGTAGAQVIGVLTQRGDGSASRYLGKGKLEELKQKMVESGCTLAIFDDELTPIQQQNIERELETKVIDRTALILDVFARHANTREGALQVKLAQEEYLLPRLAGQWSHLERLGGGIGTRGPGETQIETDRRLVRRSIQKLRSQLERVRQRRSISRDRRKGTGVPIVSIVGYTNAGKSTLFNALSRAAMPVKDQLFSTLDPVTRRVVLPSGRHVLLTDTVGFIQKLPTQIIAAFRATLEELQAADLLLHVVDITHRNAMQHTQEVTSVLQDLGLADRPTVLVLNKLDLLVTEDMKWETDGLGAQSIEKDNPKAVLISAAKRWGQDDLIKRITEMIE